MDAIISSMGAVMALVALGLVFGAVLGYAAVKFHVEADPIVDKVDAILPQTQCGQCGYPGCHPYAEAVVGGADVHLCIPGGEPTAKQLAEMLGREYSPGNDLLSEAHPPKLVAYILEDKCIGCTKCIQACPVDAIVGAAKLMHTVVADECTGCDLCVEPCPVDCIEMRPVQVTPQTWIWERPRGAGVSPGKLIPVQMIS